MDRRLIILDLLHRMVDAKEILQNNIMKKMPGAGSLLPIEIAI